MHARHYSPALGRFLQPDPDRSEANLYAYAANNPVTEMDPDGTCFIVCQVLVGALIDAVVYAATTDDFSLDGLAGAVVTGAVESAVNPLAKLGKISKVATAADKLLSKVPKANRVLTKPRLAMPGQDLYVGPYGRSYAANVKTGLNRTHTPHHAPQHARSGVSHRDGITINLRRDLHVQTQTYGRPPRNLPDRRSHLAADVRELRRILGNAGYSRSVRNLQLQELVRQNKALWAR